MAILGSPVASASVLNQSIGVNLISYLLNLLLDGAVVFQAFSYFVKFGGRAEGSDPGWLQTWVALLWLCSTAQTICFFESIYELYVLDFGNPLALELVPIGVLISVYLTAIMAFLAQGYFARRCWIFLGKPRWLAILISIMLGYILLGGLAMAVIANIVGLAGFGAVHFSALQGLYTTWLICSALMDVGITSILVWKLFLARKSGVFDTTNNTLVRFIWLSLETAAVTAVFQITACVLYISLPKSTYYNIAYEPVSKLYAICLFVHLMSRVDQRGTSSSGGSRSLPVESDQIATIGGTGARKPGVPQHRVPMDLSQGVMVSRETYEFDEPVALKQFDLNTAPREKGAHWYEDSV